jgi:hypothetical protein
MRCCTVSRLIEITQIRVYFIMTATTDHCVNRATCKSAAIGDFRFGFALEGIDLHPMSYISTYLRMFIYLRIQQTNTFL